MDREKGIEAYQALITAEEYQARLSRGDIDGLAHEYRIEGDAPVIRVQIEKAEPMAPDVTKYELRSLDGTPLPAWTAGAHIDVVVAPEFLRQYSLAGDPADPSSYHIGVLREEHGKGGSKLMHRIFSEGRKIFISKPINHFPLENTASKSFLLGGGIGITPMIAMAHELHARGDAFEIHYSIKSRTAAGFLSDLNDVVWKDHVHVHCSEDGTRADLRQILRGYQESWHVYICGPDRYMQSALEAAEQQGFPEEARHLEYFTVPEVPDYENFPFTLRLKKSGRDIRVPADRSAADVLNDQGIPVDIKCPTAFAASVTAGWPAAMSSIGISCCRRNSGKVPSFSASPGRPSRMASSRSTFDDR